MKTRNVLLAAATIALMIAVSGQAATFWLTNSETGAAVPNDTLNVDSGANFTLNVYMTAEPTQDGQTFATFIGWDVSNRTTYGSAGTPAHAGINGKITQVSTNAEIVASVNPALNFGAASISGSARETNNIALGGRPYGAYVGGGQMFGLPLVHPDTIKLYSITLKNNMASGEDYYVVLSDAVSGAVSFTTAWTNGGTAYRDGYALKIHTNVIPEPATLAMLASGLLMIIRRRKTS